ncbi:MAG: Sec-independent protein translocase protein TatB [Actinomycetota bacterium]|nr:Sec-independent protein translocase protein TatB [Actinomycetota bacterium]
MGSFGFSEMAVVALIALLVFGPDRLPELARQAGRALARFRQETSKSVAELKRAAELEDLDRELKTLRSELRQAGSGLTSGTRTRRRRAATSRAHTNGPAGGVLEPPPPIDPDAT